MSDLKLIGAVGVKVRPVTDGFRHDTKRGVEKELIDLHPEVKVEAKVEANRTQAKREIEKLQREADNARIEAKVDVKFDRGRGTAVREYLGEIAHSYEDLKRAREEAFKTRMRFPGFEEEKTLKAANKLKDTFSSLIGLNKQFGDEIQKAGFADFQKMVDRLHGLSEKSPRLSDIIDSDAQKNLSAFNDQLDRFDRAQRRTIQRVFTAEDNTRIAQANRDVQELQNALERMDTQAERRRADRQKMYEDMFGQYSLTGEAKNAEYAFENMLQRLSDNNTERVHRDAKKIKDTYEDALKNIKAKIEAEPQGLALLASRLKYASRDRKVNFFVMVNEKSLAIAEGMLKSLSGLNTLENIGRQLEGIFVKFDQFALKTGSIATAVGSITDGALWLTQAALGLGGSLAKMSGLGAMAPTMLAALATTMLINIGVFKDFGDAISGDTKALERLPPTGQKAAQAVGKIWGDMREGISVEFWGQASEAMLDFSEKTLPIFSNGITRTAGKLGSIFGKTLESFTSKGLEGKLDSMFDNLVQGYDNLSGGITALWNAINDIGLVGSQFLPKIGTYLTDNFQKFEQWVKINTDNGNMFAWIQNGQREFGALWRSMGNTINIFGGLVKAANDAGAGGLKGLESVTARVAAIVNSEPFLTRMGTIFLGARDGAAALKDGLKGVIVTLGESAGWFSDILRTAGELGGGALSNVAKAMEGVRFQKGTLDSFRGMRDLVEGIGPGLGNLGIAIGNMGTIAGGVFKGLVPLLNTVGRTLAETTTKLFQNMAESSGAMIRFLNEKVTGVVGPLGLVLDVANGILGVFNALPGPMQTVLLSFGLFAALKGPLGDVFKKLDQTPLFEKLRTQWVMQQTEAGRTLDTFERFRPMSLIWQNLSQSATGYVDKLSELNRRAAEDGAGRFQRGWQTAMTIGYDAVSRGTSMIGKALGGLVNFMGGPWGIAIFAATTALSLFAAGQAESQAVVDKLTGSIDKQTKAFNDQGLETIAKRWTELDKAGDAWANFTRGSKAANESAQAFGLSLSDITKSIASGGPSYDKLIGFLDDINNYKGLLAASQQEGGWGLSSQLKDAEAKAKDAAKAFGVSWDEIEKLSGADTSHLQSQIAQARQEAILAQKANEQMASAMGTSTEKALALANAAATLRDDSASASQKVDALKRSIDLLMGNKASAQEVAQAAADGFREAMAAAEALKEQVGQAGAAIFDPNTGLLATGKSAAADGLFKALKGQAGHVLEVAQSARDTAKAENQTLAQQADAGWKVVTDSYSQLDQFATAVGLKGDDLRKQYEQWTGTEWVFKASILASPDAFQAALEQARADGRSFDGQRFVAWLEADPSNAEGNYEQIAAKYTDWDNREYITTLGALPDPAQQTLAGAIGKMNTDWTGRDWIAIMQAAANNPSIAAVRDQLEAARTNNGAGRQAIIDAVARDLASAELDKIANARRTAQIMAEVIGVPESIRRPAGGGYNGALIDGFGRALAPGLGLQSIAKFFANGGIESHVAQIARPQTPFRVWAEPETGGEAYIPLAAAKRGRSTAILAQVAQMFGYSLSRSTAYADGGINGRRVGGNHVSVSIDRYYQHSTSTPDDLGRGIMRQAKAQGATIKHWGCRPPRNSPP